MKAQDFLKEIYLFSAMSDEERTWIAETVATKSFTAGETLFSQGSAADCLYVVRRGTVEIRKEGGRDSQKLTTLGSKSIIGEIAYVDRAPRSASAELIESSEIMIVPYAVLDSRVARDTGFGMRLFQAISHQLVKTIQRTTNDLTTLREIKLKSA